MAYVASRSSTATILFVNLIKYSRELLYLWMTLTTANTLKKYPFIKLLLPLIAGIVIQWYVQFGINTILIITGVIITTLFLNNFFSVSRRFSFRWVQGILIMLLFASMGSIIIYTKDIRHQHDWFGNYYTPGDSLLITLEEPLVEKNNSYKALASVHAVRKNEWQPSEGKMLVYFKKDSINPSLNYGSTLILYKKLQPITNSGNPGAFDYERYCLFQNITAQVFANEKDYVVLPDKNIKWLQQELFDVRNTTIKILQQYIPGSKEQGVAEALLIGYRDDLDKDLVQAYSNTGVVHIIAISGLHLGMIYFLLSSVFLFFKRYRFIQLLKPFIVLSILWAFTLIAGAVPSILRSAVMFSFIVIGESINRKTNMYNTLAASAFCMLVYNPFVLWDVGFLLSYAAVISIVTFRQPIYKWFYFQNMIVDKVWSLTSVTLSAQVLTIPIVIFYFHQFPNLFLITNFIVVPLSGIILYGEILLLCISLLPGIAHFFGVIISGCVKAMDSFIESMNTLPFAVWNNLQLNIVDTWLLYGCIIAICIWLMQKSSKALMLAVICLAVMTGLLSAEFIERNQQQKLIVYNVPKQSAIDIVEGGGYIFLGDSILQNEGFLENFHLKPARIKYRCSSVIKGNDITNNHIFTIDSTSIIVIDNSLKFYPLDKKIPINIIILSKNPKIDINQLENFFVFKELVFDSSNPLWKIELWKKDCGNLHLRFHSVPEDGAFVMDL